MRVLFLERSLGRGGAQRQLIALANGLAKRGHSVTVALFYNEGPLVQSLLTNVIELQVLGKKGRWDVAGFVLSTLRLVDAAKPDIVCTFLQVPNLIAAVCKLFRPALRLVWGIRASNVDLGAYDHLTRFSYRLEVVASRMANLVISNSKAGQNVAQARGFPSARMIVIPNGIDTARFRPDPAGRRRLREAWNVADGETLVGLIGRLDPMKDHTTFIKAAAIVNTVLPDVRFVCVGDEGPICQSDLMASAASAGVGGRMIWSGGRDDMPAVYSACDVVCSSSAYGEGFSNTLAEAMACGRRCVATNVGDALDIIASTGSVVPPRDQRALADAIAKLCKEVNEGSEITAVAREHIQKHFSIDAMVSAFEEQFRRLVE